MENSSHAPIMRHLKPTDLSDADDLDLEQQAKKVIIENAKKTKTLFGRTRITLNLSSSEFQEKSAAWIRKCLDSIEILNLSNNGLTEFEATKYLEQPSKLRELYIDKNRISVLGLQGLKRLKVLSVSANQLRALPNFDDQSRLVSLNVSRNQILRGWEELGKLRSVRRLDVSNCRIDMSSSQFCAECLEVLASLPRLERLSIEGNPVCVKIPKFEALLLRRLPGLEWLDSEPVTRSRRAAAATREADRRRVRWSRSSGSLSQRLDEVVVSRESRHARFGASLGADSSLNRTSLPKVHFSTPLVQVNCEESWKERCVDLSPFGGVRRSRSFDEVLPRSVAKESGEGGVRANEEELAALRGRARMLESSKQEPEAEEEGTSGHGLCWAAKPDAPLDVDLGDYIMQYMVGTSTWKGVFVGSSGCLLDVAIRMSQMFSEEELEACLGIRHRNLAEVLGACDKMHMRAWVVGEDCRSVLSGDAPRTRLPMARCLEVAREVALALRHLHEHGVVHGSVSSENVILAEDGRVVLTDFGEVARKDGQGREEETPTLRWMAPEMMRPDAACSKEADAYAYGVFALELIDGEDGGDYLRTLARMCRRKEVKRRPTMESVCRYLENPAGNPIGNPTHTSPTHTLIHTSPTHTPLTHTPPTYTPTDDPTSYTPTDDPTGESLIVLDRERMRLEISLSRTPTCWRRGSAERMEVLEGEETRRLDQFVANFWGANSSRGDSARVVALNALESIREPRHVAYMAEKPEFLRELLTPLQRDDLASISNWRYRDVGRACIVESTLLTLKSLVESRPFARAVIELDVISRLVACTECVRCESIQALSLSVIDAICAHAEGRRALRTSGGLASLVEMLGGSAGPSRSRRVAWMMSTILVDEADRCAFVKLGGLARSKLAFHAAGTRLQVHLATVWIRFSNYDQARTICTELHFKCILARALTSTINGLPFLTLNALTALSNWPGFVDKDAETLLLIKALLNLIASPTISHETVLAAHTLDKITLSRVGMTLFCDIGGLPFILHYLSSRPEFPPVHLSLSLILSHALLSPSHILTLSALNAPRTLIPLLSSNSSPLSLLALSALNQLANHPPTLQQLLSYHHVWLPLAISCLSSHCVPRQQLLFLQLLSKSCSSNNTVPDTFFDHQLSNSLLSVLPSSCPRSKLLILLILSRLLSSDSLRLWLFNSHLNLLLLELHSACQLNSPHLPTLRTILTLTLNALHASPSPPPSALPFVLHALQFSDPLISLHALRALDSLLDSSPLPPSSLASLPTLLASLSLSPGFSSMVSRISSKLHHHQ